MEMEDAARGAPGPTRPAPVSIIGAEDEDFENELETHPEERSSEFQSLEQVKRRPAHLMALLHHVALQFEPGPLLCCLHADMLTTLGPKEAKKGFLDFYHNFLEKTAVLRVPVPQSVSFELDRTRPELLPEETQRRFLQEVVQAQQNAISRQLEDFRSKRLMGMTPGEPDLSQLETWAARDRVSFEGRERLVAERILNRLEDIHPTISADEEKSVAIVNAISAYMRYLGVRTKSSDKKARGNFFRKKMPGNRRTDDTPKSKSVLISILDAARWNRGDAQAPDFRHPKAETDGEKLGPPERKISQVTPPKGIIGPPGPDAPGVTVHPPPGESLDKESGTDLPSEVGDPPPQGPSSSESPILPESNAEDGADTERKWKRLSGRLGRSESLRVTDRRRPSRGSLGAKGRAGGRSRSDVDTDPGSATAALGSARRATPEPGEEGEPGRAGLELEPEEPPGWRELVPLDTLSGMHKNQVKRQEVISELLVTEAAHVRMLRVLHDLFYQPMADGGFFTMDELQNIFPSLDELIDVHSLFLESLMKLRQESGYLIEEIGDVLLARFDGPEGSWFQKISSRFCSRQSFALEQLKAKQRKEPRFCTFVQEAESRPRCRRLQLKDMIPTEMQRLTKYPLLLQSIWQNTEEPKEKAKVEQAAECCKEILHHVNQSVRDMEDLLRLKDYQRRLDLSHLRQSSDPMLSEFKNLDITKKKLVHEGPLTWRVTKDKAVEVHVLLLDDLLLLLQRQDERLLLKSHSRTLTPTPDGKTMLRPVLRLTSAMTREVATDHRAFYVIFTWDQEAHIYELVAQTVSERKHWCTLITDTAGSLKVPAPPSRPKRPSPISTREPLISISENGNSSREIPQAEAGRCERILTDLLPFSCLDPEGQLAASALQEVLSLKQILLPGEEENGPGPAPESEGVSGAAQTQELRERLLNLEDTLKRLEEVEEEFCRLRLIISQLNGATPSQAGCS
ncbi:rho guanine nucleotide exchange factor 1 isoform X1 [Trichosurus vulpecula]|uniref:rho guanine nucleotide exchange factor 1 isoform X1 n=1 Tax=Trichosurus vulpecula TaxID=9337 RepID=UPI00186B569B|nr:rho guanine nucleotide exchange factor 1 isoform X1 [Trichosurus vulpecula]XP_036601642.1 rho guanine nucleotide exchange factor 1 isoform X1 [Trichosurus vulpecula]XP_036601643.1 rho guanine nucleotide exchange factor 1 isoform X1 [Trichosurus vulpecula]XP_036601644.1 rho guanine nucleotide exchange factor 1 isoform X1 [Trichosurus vulpecula]XP_036601645.1 rho guanine nucleotide exchange factor 1 isoform X1 [Trichosurus vulpecula]